MTTAINEKFWGSTAFLAFILGSVSVADGNTTPIKFARGKSSKTIESAVVRGDRDFYTFEAKAKQSVAIKITSLENNAVFDLYAPGAKIKKVDGSFEVEGKAMTEEQTNRKGVLPATGMYLIVVGGTRGNATYKLTVTIK